MTNEADIEAMAAFEDLVSKMREVLDYDFRKRTLAPPSAVGYADWNTRKAFALYKAAIASSPVERLRESNEALMRERASIIETKREQIELLESKVGRLRAENETMKHQLEPEWWYNEDGESAADAIDLAVDVDLHDGYIKVYGAAEVCVRYVADIVLSYDDDGCPDKTEYRVFNTEEDAKQALEGAKS